MQLTAMALPHYSQMIRSVLVGIILYIATLGGQATAADPKEIAPAQLKAIVHRYFHADPNYHDGDLLTRSQLAEMQLYLRRVRGNTLASHRKWRDLMLPDNAPLISIYRGDDQGTLREAAIKAGSYAELDRLARTLAGREKIQAALKQKSADQLLALIEEARAGQHAEESSASTADRRPRRIYSADDFIASVVQSHKK